MKTFFLLLSCIIAASFANGQVQYKPGPELANDKSIRMNRMVNGDDNTFYNFRLQRRDGTVGYYIEKFDKQTLQMIFQKDISLGKEDLAVAKVEEVLYANETVYVFRRVFDKQTNKVSISYQTISSQGEVSKAPVVITSVGTESFYFADVEFFQSPSKGKILTKLCWRRSEGGASQTDFVLSDVKNAMNKVWSKTIKKQLDSRNIWGMISGRLMNRPDLGLVGLQIDDNDNLYFGFTEDAPGSTEKQRQYRLFAATMTAAQQEPTITELKFDKPYWVTDTKFFRLNEKEMVIAGFMQLVDGKRDGREHAGIFNFTLNPQTGIIVNQNLQLFDEELVRTLDSRSSSYTKYKLDHIFPVGESVYFVGQQYVERYDEPNWSSSSTRSPMFNYHYMDVIVTKMNSGGKFEWIKNVPFRNSMTIGFAHVFKQYVAVATEKNIYILGNEHPENLKTLLKKPFDPKDFRTITTLHQTNFMGSQVDLQAGNVTRALVFENKKYCFAPIQERNHWLLPPSSVEIFVPGKGKEALIYLEDRGKDQFAKLQFE